jgi:hypothetical protein
MPRKMAFIFTFLDIAEDLKFVSCPTDMRLIRHPNIFLVRLGMAIYTEIFLIK